MEFTRKIILYDDVWDTSVPLIVISGPMAVKVTSRYANIDIDASNIIVVNIKGKNYARGSYKLDVESREKTVIYVMSIARTAFHGSDILTAECKDGTTKISAQLVLCSPVLVKAFIYSKDQLIDFKNFVKNTVENVDKFSGAQLITPESFNSLTFEQIFDMFLFCHQLEIKILDDFLFNWMFLQAKPENRDKILELMAVYEYDMLAPIYAMVVAKSGTYGGQLVLTLESK